MQSKNLIAVDLGASSGRVVSGKFDGHNIEIKEQLRFSNIPVDIADGLYWDYIKIFQQIKYGLSIAYKDIGTISSMGVDSWGVDYGFLTNKNEVLFAPHSYRDTRNKYYETAFLNEITKNELFKWTGNQHSLINSNVQLFADIQRYPFIKDNVKQILMIPNLINFLFSGKLVNEFTITSTSGLLQNNGVNWNYDVIKRLGLPIKWFKKIKICKNIGDIKPSIVKELQLNSDINVIASACHDTAAALLALPITTKERENTAFISCGTWSIVGNQTQKPIINDVAFDLGLTNEGCFDGTNRLLKNITGLWIIQELQKEWSYKGNVVTFEQMVSEASEVENNDLYIDVSDDSFTSPNQMEEKIMEFLRKTGQKKDITRGQLLRLVLESLAFAYKDVINSLEKATGKYLQTIHMFGGGIQNKLLVQLTADFSQKRTIIGPVEASVIGNMVSQLISTNNCDTASIVSVLKNSFEINTIRPRKVIDLDKNFTKFKKIQDLGRLRGE